MKRYEIIKILVGIVLFDVLMCNFVYADYNYAGSNLRGKAQMEKILEAKKSKTIEMPAYISGYSGEVTQEEIDDYEENEKYYARYDERDNEADNYIRAYNDNKRNNEIEKKNNSDIKIANYTKYKTILIVISICVIIAFFIILVFRLWKVLFIILPIAIIVFLLFTMKLIKYTNTQDLKLSESSDIVINSDTQKLLDLLNEVAVDDKLEKFAEKYKKENIDIYNANEVDISRVINDYLIKCYYCVKRKANNNELYSADLDVLNCFSDEFHNYDLKNHIPYTKAADRDKYEFVIANNLLTRESMQWIYDNLSDEDIENYNNGTFLDVLISNIEKNIKSSEDYDAYNIIPYDYFNIVRLDEAPILKCKYWYLEKGTETTINLPYGATFKYELPKYIKKDVIEWKDAYIKKMQNDPDGESTIFAYYINKIETFGLCGIFTTVNKDGLYNIKELNNDIIPANAIVYTESKNNISVSNNMNVANERKDIDKIIRFGCVKHRKRESNYFTDKFLIKYKENSVIDDDEVDTIQNLTTELIDENSRIQNMYLCKIKYLGSKKDEYALFKLHWQDDKVDDIEYYIVPEDKMNLSYEEMYKLAFND